MSGPATSIWRPQRDGVLFRVRLTPGASRDAIASVMETADGTALAVRVRAVPEHGAANAALEALLAGWLTCSKSCVSIASGHRSRVKTVAVAGDAVALDARLSSLVAELESARIKQ
jgi:uncharacterized protein YggU (UPF0235/DUF167 family)